MVRPRRTTAEIKDLIVQHAAVYTIARTDWEGERREVKKTALRTMARLVRQLCGRRNHAIGAVVAGDPGIMNDGGKCPVCDTSGDVKREAATGQTAEELRKEKIEKAFRRTPEPKLPTGECSRCHATCHPKYIVDGICDICRETKSNDD